VRVQNIYNAENFDRSLRPAAEFIAQHVNDFKTMPVTEQIAAATGIKLNHIPDLNEDHFNWFMCDGNSTPPYEKCSGAQRFFIGLAVRIALGRLGSSNIINDQLFQDEGFTACDAETMEKVPGLLRNLLKDSNKLNSIFIVSHMEQLKVSATGAITIIRGATSSRLNVGERFAMPKAIPLMVQDAVPVPVKKRGRPKKGEPTIEVADS
jgi:ABC-type lipoprotein export system ATPase subunit